FGLSVLVQSGEPQDAISARVQEELRLVTEQQDFRLDLEAFAGATLPDDQCHIGLFGRLMAGVNMTFDELYRGDVGKNVLNFFRQDHGYKDGSYRKHWHDGREDNEHLVEAIQSLDTTKLSFKDELYEALLDRYKMGT